MGQPAGKKALRRELLAARRELPESVRADEGRQLAEAAVAALTGEGPGTACAYVPVGPEPGSLELLEGLRGLGWRVLLPVVVGEQPLDWAEYTGRESLSPAVFGLLEPTGPRLGPEAIGQARLVFVPALAIDHRGVRLGRGGGHYDRSLPMVSAGARLVGVVRDGEFVAELPSEEHDIRVGAVLTPGRGLVPLPA